VENKVFSDNNTLNQNNNKLRTNEEKGGGWRFKIEFEIEIGIKDVFIQKSFSER